MNTRNRRNLSEEMELRHKQSELALLGARHAEARTALTRLVDEIARFESLYHDALGRGARSWSGSRRRSRVCPGARAGRGSGSRAPLSGPARTVARKTGKDPTGRICGLAHLRRLYLYHSGISDNGLAHLPYLPELATVTCCGNGITDGGLAAFRLAAPAVKTVSFDWKR